MSEAEIGRILLSLGIVIALTQLLGYVFYLLRQPRLIGEILAGILIGPFVLGHLAPKFFEQFFGSNGATADVLGFMYWLGILFLMFISGSQVRNLMAKENRRPTAFLLGIGKPVAFLSVIVLGMFSIIPLQSISGSEGQDVPVLLILACAVAVTSIPVISRIFQELKIMETRFASLVLGAAVLEDVALWGIVAVATSYTLTVKQGSGAILVHIFVNLAFLVAGLIILPKILGILRRWRGNILVQTSPIAYAIVIFSLYVGLAGFLQVNLVFAAFLAGFGLVGGARGMERAYFKDTLSVIEKFSFSVLVPIYFALVGYRLVFNDSFSFAMLMVFLVASSLIAIVSVAFSAKLAGFNRLDMANLAITLNARGGPGIVLASVAYEAHIINAPFYTTLVLTALITSMIAGSWLRYVLNKGLPLLSASRA